MPKGTRPRERLQQPPPQPFFSASLPALNRADHQ